MITDPLRPIEPDQTYPREWLKEQITELEEMAGLYDLWAAQARGTVVLMRDALRKAT